MIFENFSDRIKKSLSTNTKALQDGILKYIDKYSYVLYTYDFTENMYFSDDDKELLFTCIGIDKKEMMTAIKQSKYFNPSFKISSNPFYVACMLAIGYYVKVKNKDMATLVGIYMSCNMWVSIHSNSMQFKGNKAIMDYTVANMNNNFKLKQLGTIYKLIEDNVVTWLNTYIQKGHLIRMKDNDVIFVTNALQARIKGKMVEIFRAFYKNHKSGKYLNMESDSYEEGNFRQLENNSYVIARLADKAFLNMIQKSPSDTFIKYSITKSDVSFDKLKSIIVDIVQDNNNDDVVKLLRSILEHYMLTSTNTIDTVYKGEFVTYMMTAYSSNSNSPQLKFIKDTIERWVNEYSVKFSRKAFGSTTMNSYKKSVFMFFVYTLNYEAKTT